MSKPPLPHGLDDLQLGIDLLLSTAPGAQREAVAATIIDTVGSIPGTAASILVNSVSRFAAWGGNEDAVREDFHQFIVASGEWVGAEQVNHKANTARRKASEIGAVVRKERAAEARESADKWFDQAFSKMPEAGHVQLLTLAKQLLVSAQKDANNDLNRFTQAANQFGVDTTTTKLVDLRKAMPLLTIRRAKAFLAAQKAR